MPRRLSNEFGALAVGRRGPRSSTIACHSSDGSGNCQSYSGRLKKLSASCLDFWGAVAQLLALGSLDVLGIHETTTTDSHGCQFGPLFRSSDGNSHTQSRFGDCCWDSIWHRFRRHMGTQKAQRLRSEARAAHETIRHQCVAMLRPDPQILQTYGK